MSKKPNVVKRPKPKRPNYKKGGNSNRGILLSSLSYMPPGYVIIHPGVVTGRAIRSMGVITSFLSGISRFIGTKQDWTGVENVLDKARDEAMDHIIEKSRQYSADAIFGINIELSEIASGTSNALLVCTVTGTMCRKL